jgi:transposase
MLNDLIFQKFEIRHLVTAAYHPQTNGQDERTNGTLKRHLSKVRPEIALYYFLVPAR